MKRLEVDKNARIYANTTIGYPTHFPAALQLIQKGRKEFCVSSENWPYPTKYFLGKPDIDKYYAEIWVDGMDWQHNYWLIESVKWDEPRIQPLIIFASHDEEDKFNAYDFENFMMAILWLRRDELWIKEHDHTRYSDEVWPFVHIGDEEFDIKRGKALMRCMYMEHASQPKVGFHLNDNCIHELFVKYTVRSVLK